MVGRKLIQHVRKVSLAVAGAGVILSGTSAIAKAPGPEVDPSVYRVLFDSQYYVGRYPDVRESCGYSEEAVWDHFVDYGLEEGRQGSRCFKVQFYMDRYPDLKEAFGDDLEAYYVHFVENGMKEGRLGTDEPLASCVDRSILQAYADEVLAKTNEARAEAGLKPLTLDAGLCTAAKLRADECLISYSHERPDGRDFYTAMDDAGADYRVCGENLGKGYKTGLRAVNGWLNSEGHRKNLLNPKYSRIGIAVSQSEKGTFFVSQEFAD